MNPKKPKLHNNPLAWVQAKRADLQGVRLSDVQYIAPQQLKINPLNRHFFREESEDYFSKLRDDIRERGIIVPLLAKKDDVLLAGHNRLQVALELGLQSVPVQYVLDTLTEAAEREFIIKDNLYRRQFSTAEWISLYKKLYPDFDVLIRQETRGGGLKWSKKSAHDTSSLSKTESSVLLSESTSVQRLTAQKIAQDTGQNVSAVQKQLAKYRKELQQKLQQEEGFGNKTALKNVSSKNAIQIAKKKDTAVIEKANRYISELQTMLKHQNPQTLRPILRKVEGLKTMIERLLTQQA
ncbi:MAG: ParB/RepB/Spo0J family partition protein [Bacteroidota bacterium]|nr:ParB/RepB/Spo0J family partition protein [Candidatus Kapabacteria bacterium]MDW8219013.1 ParB/RepB/Spo0J family partition protein [Bacteroidota bacterium]